MASRNDQCVWAVGVVAGHVLLDRALNDVISGQCVFKTSLPCFRSFFEVATS